MRGVSEEFIETLAGSHNIAVVAKICARGQTGKNPDGVAVDVIGGDVDYIRAGVSGSAATRGTADILINGVDLWPGPANGLLAAPYGNELFLGRGVDFGGGRTEVVSLGYFRIQTPSQQKLPSGPIRLLAYDRMAQLADEKLIAPRQFTAATSRAALVANLVQEVYPAAVIVWDDGSTLPIGRNLICDEDRFKFLDDFVTSLGKIWYWDGIGQLRIKNPPAVSAPVWEVKGGRGGVLIEAARELTREDTYSIVVARGEAAGSQPAVRAVAYNDDAASPTYWKGDFGAVPWFHTDAAITTQSQAAAAASALLRRQVGLPYSISFGSIVNPAVEPWDPLRIEVSDREGYVVHVLSTVRIPLLPDVPMTGTTREQTTLKIVTTS